MDAIDQVANVLLGSRGNTYCNSCLAESLAFERRHDIQRIMSALADSASFQRVFGTCSICGSERLVISTALARR
jgi:hypothetical protein